MSPMTPAQRFTLHLLASIVLHVLALLSLTLSIDHNWETISRTESATKGNRSLPRTKSPHSITRTRLLGILAAASLLTTPFTLPTPNPIPHLLLRTLAFFYAAKLLDLTVARAHTPPLLLSAGHPIRPQTPALRLRYISRLFTECRYYSFNTPILHPARPSVPARPNYAPIFFIPVVTFLLPSAETFSLCGLLAISQGLEAMHSLLHPRCPHKLFWRPFEARSLSAFWSTHWQQAAAPFLVSLGYRPAKILFTRLGGEKVGKAMGVLAAFALSGVWHGWAAGALTTTPWRTGLGIGGIFVGHGVGCVLEKVWGVRREGSLGYGLLVWTVALLAVGWWVRDSLPRSNLEFVVRIWEG